MAAKKKKEENVVLRAVDEILGNVPRKKGQTEATSKKAPAKSEKPSSRAKKEQPKAKKAPHEGEKPPHKDADTSPTEEKAAGKDKKKPPEKAGKGSLAKVEKEADSKGGPEKSRKTGSIVYRCVACEDMTKVLSPSCRACQTPNGYQPTPAGTRLPKKKHGIIKQAGGFGSFGDGDFGSSGGIGSGRGKDDDNDFDPDDEADVVPIGEIEVEDRDRISTGIPSLDRVLGGNAEEGYGIVSGSSVMIDGSPGIGKSTLLIQALAKLAEEGPVLYVTGEESASDIKARAQRLKILTRKNKKNILVVETTDTDQIIEIIEDEEPIAVILDSIQMFYSEEASGQAGSEPQCKYILENLIRGTCKPMGIALFVVSQVTKGGDARGPQTIAHMVDAHFKFESIDPKNRGETKRILHQKKNRNGDIATIRYFRMTEHGLIGLKPTGKERAPADDDDDRAALFT